MEDFCKYISGVDNIWFATNIEVVDYIYALRRLRFTLSGDVVYNTSAIDVWIGVNNEPIKIGSGKRIEIGR